MIEVHPIAAAGFGSSAEAYERGRPDYPSAAIGWLGQRVGLKPGVTVIDLGAGTGKLSRPLAATGARVIAIEPVEAMRGAIGPEIEAVEGAAEKLPLPDGSSDVVTVGQAFHWFDGAVALAEIHRVLRPGGSLALIWNVRRMEDPIHAAIEELIKGYVEQVPRHRTGTWRNAFARTDLFGPLDEMHFPHEQLLDAHGLAARVGSISAIAALSHDERTRILEGVRSLAGGGRVKLRYICEVQIVERVGDPL
jgi:SAM-dependent methyltransferase